MTNEFSTGELLKDYIDKLIEDDYDFSHASKRREAMHAFCELNKDKGFKPEKIRTYFRKILTKCLTEKDIDPRPTGVGKRELRAVPAPSGIVPKITPEPVPSSTTTEQPKTLAPPEDQQQEQAGEEKQVTYEITKQHVAAFCVALYLVLKIKWSLLEDLTTDEKNTLAEMWLPCFQRYMGEKMKLVILPTIGTIGIIAPKIHDARKLKKEKEVQEQEKKKGNGTLSVS